MKKLFWVLSLLALSGELSALRNGCVPGTKNCGNCFDYIPPIAPGCMTDTNGLSDFDADRKNDLLYRNQTLLDLQAWMRYAGGQAGWRTFIPRGMPDSHWVAVATGYFDGGGVPLPKEDLYSDILWQHDTTGQVRLWLMKQAQKRESELILTCPPAVDPCSDPAPPWEVVATGFFGAPDGGVDGVSDILFWNSTTGALKLWIMDSSPPRVVQELPLNIPQLSTGWKVIGAGFFDDGPADETSDILWFNANTGDVQLWLMNGTILREAWPVGQEKDLDWKAVGVVDLNRNNAPGYPDGHPDILFRKKTTGRLRIWEMNGPSPTGNVVVPSIIEPSDLNWKPVPR